MNPKYHLIWIDLEMTGLNPTTERIIEIATLVTDADLNILAEGPELAIYQPDSVLEKMDDWNQRQHLQSGLLERVRSSQISEADAESVTLSFLEQYLLPGRSPMCGNSICLDRRFLVNYMPRLASFFHYRNLDVSTLKELVIRWKPQLLSGFTKQSKHLAMEDIKDSIAELIYYREHFIHLSGPVDETT